MIATADEGQFTDSCVVFGKLLTVPDGHGGWVCHVKWEIGFKMGMRNMKRVVGVVGAAVMAFGVLVGPATAQQVNESVVAQVENMPQLEVVAPEALGIYRSSAQPDPLSRRYRSDAPLTVFNTDFTVSVQPPGVAARDFEGNEQVRLPR